MCRVLSYLGSPVPVEDILYKPDNSFIKQSYNPKYMTHLLNLAGFGMIAWDPNSHDPQLPFIYKTSGLPFYDENLRNLSAKVLPHCLLTHIRGVSYSKNQVVSNQNVHPFLYPGTKIALAHNGSLSEFDKMKPGLFNAINPDFSRRISGTTDTEWIYGLFLTQLHNPVDVASMDEIYEAIVKTFKIIVQLRKKCNISTTSPLNLFISNGKFIAATRYTMDYGWHGLEEDLMEHYAYHSLWYTYGENYGLYDNVYRMKNGEKRACIIIASEPLTEDTTTWVELPEYTFIMAWREQEEIKIVSHDIAL